MRDGEKCRVLCGDVAGGESAVGVACERKFGVESSESMVPHGEFGVLELLGVKGVAPGLRSGIGS